MGTTDAGRGTIPGPNLKTSLFAYRNPVLLWLSEYVWVWVLSALGDLSDRSLSHSLVWFAHQLCFRGWLTEVGRNGIGICPGPVLPPLEGV